MPDQTYTITCSGPASASITFTPSPFGGKTSPQTTSFNFTVVSGDVTVTAPAVAGWDFAGWYIGAAQQTASAAWLITFRPTFTAIAKYTESAGGTVLTPTARFGGLLNRFALGLIGLIHYAPAW